MSRLVELIAELCPDGVPYVELKEISEYLHTALIKFKWIVIFIRFIIVFI